MKLRLALATFALALSPVVASAMCGHDTATQSTSQCVDGQTWDATNQVCVPVTNS